MTDYNLQKGDTITFTAVQPCKLRLDDFGGLVHVEAFDLIQKKREEAKRLLEEADSLERAKDDNSRDS